MRSFVTSPITRTSTNHTNKLKTSIKISLRQATDIAKSCQFSFFTDNFISLKIYSRKCSAYGI